MENGLQQYERSITKQAEKSMNRWTKKLSDMSYKLMKDPIRIVESLNDRRELCTPGFLMRRQIQGEFLDILNTAKEETKEVYKDLFVSNNVPWPDTLIRSLCSKMAKYVNTNYNQSFTTTQWKSWLTDNGIPNRLLAIKLSFFLNMDDYTTTKFLLACGHEPFSVRNPLDCICLFCKSLRPKGDWNKVEEILSQYEKNRPEPAPSNKKNSHTVGTLGKTSMIEGAVSEYASTHVPEYMLEDVQNGLIEYMYSIDSEFTRPKTNYKKKEEKTAENKKIYKKQKEKIIPSYLSGYSLERCLKYLELTRYMVLLYPEYNNSAHDGGDQNLDVRTKKKYEELGIEIPVTNIRSGKVDISDGGIVGLLFAILCDKDDIREVKTDEDGFPDLKELSYAFEFVRGWDFAEASGLGLVPYDEKTKTWKKTSKKKERHDSIPFNRDIYRICYNYVKDGRMGDIARLKNQIENAAPVERKDILLMAYLFITEYAKKSVDTSVLAYSYID